MAGDDMKDLGLLIWFTQLGISVCVPLAGYTLLAFWLHRSHGWGTWVIWVGIILGIVSAVGALRDALCSMNRYIKRNAPPPHDPPAVSFSEHD